MAPTQVRVLCIHGIGHQSITNWKQGWEDRIRAELHGFNPAVAEAAVFEGVNLDAVFEQFDVTLAQSAKAVRLAAESGLRHGLGIGRSRAFISPDTIRWTWGMVAQWLDDDKLRARLRELILAAVAEHDPTIIAGHSLGSLVGYDTFIRGAGRDAIADRRFLSFGSQIGSVFTRETFAGRIVELPKARGWTHLFNPRDRVLTASIDLPEAVNFTQVETEFSDGFISTNHDAEGYLKHPAAVGTLWSVVAAEAAATAKQFAKASAAAKSTTMATAARKPTRRALLVAINDYPDPAQRLEGCLNDAFLMSALLQESGYRADDIRVVFDNRATAAGIADRVDWLLSDSRDKDERVLFYSGHGAQIPAYGPDETVDRMDECLVPHDFAWSADTAFTDNQFAEMYTQLPYGVRFLSIFDCCHSGGMTRDGAGRARGITPPDDIRHRALRWDEGKEMWVPRDLEPTNKDLTSGKARSTFQLGGDNTHRLGRAVTLRTLGDKAFDRERKAAGHHGPYMPLIYEACGEAQLAYEYRHGVTSYGAFTYSLVSILRRARRTDKTLTFQQLSDEAGKTLHTLGYAQTPFLAGPDSQKIQAVPFRGDAKGSSEPSADAGKK